MHNLHRPAQVNCPGVAQAAPARGHLLHALFTSRLTLRPQIERWILHLDRLVRFD